MLQEASKFFSEKEQRNEFISFLEYIKSKRLALISKDLFDIFEMHGIPEGEKRSQVNKKDFFVVIFKQNFVNILTGFESVTSVTVLSLDTLKCLTT